MTSQWLKPAALGILAGAALFAIPFFIFKVLAFFFILGLVRRLWWGPSWGAYGHGYARHGRYGMWHKLRDMSDEDRNAFFAKMREGGCGPRVPVPPSEGPTPTDSRLSFM